jgi:hypothetical protein
MLFFRILIVLEGSVIKLPDNALLTVIRAEEKAEKIRDDARSQAYDMIRAAELYEKNKMIKAREEAIASANVDLDKIVSGTKDIIRKNDLDVKAEAEHLSRAAEPKKKEAVKEIIWELMRQCK